MLTEGIRQRVRPILRALSKNRYADPLLRGLGRVGVLPEFLRLRLPVERSFQASLPEQPGFIYESTYGDLIGRSLYWNPSKSYELETIRVFHKIAQGAKFVLDIGANTGLYTLVACAANPFSRVMGFEPVQHVRERLIRNIQLNGWGHRCQVRPEAVSNFVGSAKFYVPYGDSPIVSRLDLHGFTEDKGYITEVPVTKLDDICAEDEQVDLVKLDVEGSEDKVLEGMKRVLEASTPAIFLECLPGGPIREIEAILTPLGYGFFQLHPEGPIRIPSLAADPQCRFRNVLCAGKPRESLPW